MILVTGAAGKTGRAVIQALAERDLEVRAWVRRAEQEALVRKAGAVDVLWGDLRSSAVAARACRGVLGIYHLCPNVSPSEVPIGRGIIAAALDAGVERFVYHSVLHPHTQAMPHHWRKLLVEEHLLESGLDWTILRPGAYFQNLLAVRDRVIEEGIYPVPYALESRIALVDLEDVAEVAARVLTEPGHIFATYDLCSGEAPDQVEIAVALGAALGSSVRAVIVDRDAWDEQARQAGLAGEAREALLAMFRYYEQYGLLGNGNVLTWLLDRQPVGLGAFLERELVVRNGGRDA